MKKTNIWYNEPIYTLANFSNGRKNCYACHQIRNFSFITEDADWLPSIAVSVTVAKIAVVYVTSEM